MNRYVSSLPNSERQKLIDMGIIIENAEVTDVNSEEQEENPNGIPADIETFPDANYDLQNEIIRFFVNNPGAEPEIFRQYATSIGIEPEEFQKQANILLSQLLQIYISDSEELGYGNALTSDDEISAEIQQMVTPDEEGENI